MLVNRKSIEIRQLSSLDMALNIHGKGFTIPKPRQILKLLIWRQKWVAGVLLIVRRVPQGTIIAVLF